jgi:hypothetical protein
MLARQELLSKPACQVSLCHALGSFCKSQGLFVCGAISSQITHTPPPQFVDCANTLLDLPWLRFLLDCSCFGMTEIRYRSVLGKLRQS